MQEKTTLRVFGEDSGVTKEFFIAYPRSAWQELLPAELPFHTSHPVKLCLDDEEALHRQLVCWWLMQQFFLQVLKQPMFEVWEIRIVEGIIDELERGNSKLCNYHSPTKFTATDNPMTYPPYIRTLGK